MGMPSYMRSVFEQNIIMGLMTVTNVNVCKLRM